MTCPQCRNDVPALDFCVRCGFPLGVQGARVPRRWSARRRFAAAPTERANAPHITSTLYPKLPDQDLRTFRVALGVGAALVLGLAVAGLYPMGVAVAVALVPMLLVLYINAVDVHENHPWSVLALTMAWGLVAGVAVGWVLRGLAVPIVPPGWSQLAETENRIRTFVVPVVDVALALVGPIVLLRRPYCNDVLDGATFGAVTGATLVAGQTLGQADRLFAGGLRPPGDSLTWTLRLLELGVLIPILFAAAVGFASGALWLRYRSPLAHREALGAFGHPVVAIVAAMVIAVAAAFAQQLLDPVPAFLALVALTALALLGLRRCIHVGLIEQAIEIVETDPVACANCHRPEVRFAFCGHCGIARRALPSAEIARPARTMAAAVGGLFLVATIAGVFVLLATPDAPASPCPARGVCGIPPPPPIRSDRGTTAVEDAAASATPLFALDAGLFEVDAADEREIRLRSKDLGAVEPDWKGVGVSVWVTSTRSDELASDLVARRRDALLASMPFLQEDPEPSTKVVVASLGRVRGSGGSYRGHLDTPQGPRTPVVAAIIAARRNGEAAVLSYVITGTSDTRIIRQLRASADRILNTFEWEDDR
jgi:hypothetical protein